MLTLVEYDCKANSLVCHLLLDGGLSLLIVIVTLREGGGGEAP